LSSSAPGPAEASAFAAASSAARTASNCCREASADRVTARRTEADVSFAAYSRKFIVDLLREA
jgi:hypothetical protein